MKLDEKFRIDSQSIRNLDDESDVGRIDSQSIRNLDDESEVGRIDSQSIRNSDDESEMSRIDSQLIGKSAKKKKKIQRASESIPNRLGNQPNKKNPEGSRIDSQSIRKSAMQGESREQPNRFLFDQQIGSGARTAANRFSID